MKKYDIVIIGGGAAGLVAAKTAKGLGKKVAILEKNKMGGECTHTGCIPSKALIKSARVLYDIKHAEDFGLKAKVTSQTAVLRHVRDVVKSVYSTHTPQKLSEDGFNLYFGNAKFQSSNKVSINNEILEAKKIILATGSSPFIPPIPGLAESHYLTNDNIFDLKTIPKSLIVIGGGAIGVELAQSFSRLGTKVCLVEREAQILSKEDSEIAERLVQKLQSEGVKVLRNNVVEKVKDNTVFINGQKLKAEHVLIAVGRKLNLDDLNLNIAGVNFSAKGVIVNKKLQTTVKNIYACGDIVGPYQFSHMAEYQGIIAATNTCLPSLFHRKIDYSHTCWTTFSDPELAHAGLTEKEGIAKYGKVKVYHYEYRDIDRGHTELENGFSKIICDRKHRIVGVHILGHSASEVMHELQLAKSLGLPFYKIRQIIHSYPSYSDVIRQPAKLSYIDFLHNNFFIKCIKAMISHK